MIPLPDVRVGAEILRFSEKTGRQLKSLIYVFHAGRCCGQLTALPLRQNGTVQTNASGLCPFCGGKR